jgi:hypothetical protein
VTLWFRVVLPPTAMDVTAAQLETLNAAVPGFGKKAAITILPPDEEDEPAKPKVPEPGQWKCLIPGCDRSFAGKHALDVHRARGHPKKSNIPEGVV